jgi:hypothetical protein
MTTLIGLDNLPDYQGLVESLTDSLIKSELVSDTNIGGVARILIETFAREMATFYDILGKAHEAGYLDTAEGQALDSVVSILGVTRTQPELLRGQVVFSRGTPAPQEIAIPAGTRVTGPPLEGGNAIPLMESVEKARIRRGERSVSVPVQEVVDDEKSEIASLPPLSLSIMPLPLLGVDKISNPEPIMRGGQEESDRHLRARARAVLREGQKGTLEAIEAAVRSVGIQTVKALDQSEERIGCVEVRVGDPKLEGDFGRQQSVKNAVNAVKAAGIHVDWKFLRSVYCRVVVIVTPEDKNIEADSFDELARDLEQEVTDYINQLGPGTSIAEDKLKAVLLGNEMVQKADIEMNMFELKSPSLKDATELRDRLTKGQWYIDPKEEKAIVNPDRWPVEILHKPLKLARLHISARMDPAVGSMEEASRKVKEAIEFYLQANRQKRVDDTPRAYELEYANLDTILKAKEVVKELLQVWLIHEDDGQVEYLTKDQYVTLRDGEQLDFGRIDIRQAEDD